MSVRIVLDMKYRIAFFVVLAVLLATGPVARAAGNDDAKLKLWYDKPAGSWTSALPIGNGGFGAMIFGQVEERVQFNHDTLWKAEPNDYANKGAVKIAAGDTFRFVPD